jgi:hypothetical protein
MATPINQVSTAYLGKAWRTGVVGATTITKDAEHDHAFQLPAAPNAVDTIGVVASITARLLISIRHAQAVSQSSCTVDTLAFGVVVGMLTISRTGSVAALNSVYVTGDYSSNLVTVEHMKMDVRWHHELLYYLSRLTLGTIATVASKLPLVVSTDSYWRLNSAATIYNPELNCSQAWIAGAVGACEVVEQVHGVIGSRALVTHSEEGPGANGASSSISDFAMASDLNGD